MIRFSFIRSRKWPHLPKIRRLYISHNAPYLAPQILHNLCVSFLLGITTVPREIENNANAKFWGANKVHYGRCASGVYLFLEKQQFNQTFRLCPRVPYTLEMHTADTDLPIYKHLPLETRRKLGLGVDKLCSKK